MPRKTCAVFCDACIHGVTAALVSPRQLTPMRNPSGPSCGAGFKRSDTNLLYGRFVRSAARSHGVMVRQGNVLGTSFHPELTTDPRVHGYFLKMVERAVPRGKESPAA